MTITLLLVSLAHWRSASSAFSVRTARKSSSRISGGIHEVFHRICARGENESNPLSRFGRVIVIGFEFQLAYAAFGVLDVIAYLAEILRLDELSIGSGMAVEITHFHNLLHAREWITVGHSHRAHETRPIAVQEIHGDGAMAVTRLFVGFRADNEGC